MEVQAPILSLLFAIGFPNENSLKGEEDHA
jgi:hypothetical protein